ncbi:MAG: alkylphosphonate utilization protein [Chlamydiales bacterium]|nr:alkylphosphonate utilization protein [Chlamydiales bacterium]NCF71609.1 alkylphosphonate utilization protein [Chlamydiales bacterium]
MESLFPSCSKCGCEYTYEDGFMYICPECAHEWPIDASTDEVNEELTTKDAHGNTLKDGDSITVIKDLKVKGAPNAIKVGTKVKNIRIVEPKDGHDIDCNIKGFGAMMLKSEFVKKSN